MTRKQLFHEKSIKISENDLNKMYNNEDLQNYHTVVMDYNLSEVLAYFEYINDIDFHRYIMDYNTYCYKVYNCNKIQYYCIISMI